MRTCKKVLLIILIINVDIFANDTLINQIDSYLNTGNSQSAVNLIQAFIDTNPGADNVPGLLDKYISIESDINSAIAYLKELENIVTGNGNRFYIFKNLALLEELYGRIDSAQMYFHNAAVIADNQGQAECYFESSRLLYELGNIDMAIIELSTIFLISSNLDLISRAFVLKGHLVKSAGDYEEAKKIYNIVINNYKGTNAEIEAVFSMIVLNYYYLSDITASEKYLDLLHLIASQSPEYQIAYNLLNQTNTYITIAVTPQRFLEYYKINEYAVPDVPEVQKIPEVTEMETTVVEKAPEEEGGIYIQTGSFIIKENAEYMIIDLADAGFRAEILSAFVNNTLYYKVVIGTFTSSEEANVFLIRIKESGFPGFLLF